MDEFENESFDWKKIPAEKHPKNCVCPICDYTKEQISNIKNGGSFSITIKMCQEHYKAWLLNKNLLFKKLTFRRRITIKILLKVGFLRIKELSDMQSDLCMLCRIGGGGRRIEVSPLT